MFSLISYSGSLLGIVPSFYGEPITECSYVLCYSCNIMKIRWKRRSFLHEQIMIMFPKIIIELKRTFDRPTSTMIFKLATRDLQLLRILDNDFDLMHTCSSPRAFGVHIRLDIVQCIRMHIIELMFIVGHHLVSYDAAVVVR